MREYVVTVSGIEHTMLLTEADAKRYGAKARPVQNKSTTPQNKGGASDDNGPNARPARSRRK